MTNKIVILGSDGERKDVCGDLVPANSLTNPDEANQQLPDLVIKLDCPIPESGNSAYKVWLEAGNDGSVDEFLQSLKGEDGADGLDGKDGEKGEKGEKGDQGIQGAQGVQGINGKSAYEVWLDHMGDQTLSMEDFFEYIKGDQGIQGIQGIQGVKGDQGVQGIQGATGPKGDQGDTGPQGVQGPKGDTGPQGAAGPQGATGPQGVAGVDGADGIDGEDGIDGITPTFISDPTGILTLEDTATPHEYKLDIDCDKVAGCSSTDPTDPTNPTDPTLGAAGIVGNRGPETDELIGFMNASTSLPSFPSIGGTPGGGGSYLQATTFKYGDIQAETFNLHIYDVVNNAASSPDDFSGWREAGYVHTPTGVQADDLVYVASKTNDAGTWTIHQDGVVIGGDTHDFTFPTGEALFFFAILRRRSTTAGAASGEPIFAPFTLTA